VRMKFIGKDGSMGYKTGDVYDVEIKSSGKFIILSSKGYIRCPYSSIKALLQNWEELK